MIIFDAIVSASWSEFDLLKIAMIIVAGVWVVFTLRRGRRGGLGGIYDRQMKAINQATMRKKPLMNKSEYVIYRALEQRFNKGQGGRVFAQVSLGEIIQTHHDEAFRAINSKRVDFLIIDPFGNALIAVEYQGSGHEGNYSKERDAIKQICFRRAGIHFLEIVGNIGRDDECREIIAAVDQLLVSREIEHRKISL